MIAIRDETRHTVVLLAGTGATTLLGLTFGVYVTRALGDGAVGAFTHALSVVAFLQIALGPINGTVAKFAADYASNGAVGRIRSLVSEVSTRVAKYGLVALVVASIVVFPLASFWKYASPLPLLLALAITYVTLLLSVARGALRGMQRFGSLNANTIFESGCRLAVGLGLLAYWREPTAALAAYTIALLFTLGLSQRQLRSMWIDTPREPIDGRAIRQFALPMFVFMVTSAGFQNIDMLVAKRVLSAVDADSYGVAFYLTGRAIAVLVTPFNILLLPMLTHLHAARASALRPFLRVCSYFLLLAGLPLMLFAIYSPQLLHIPYDGRFSDAAAILFPLAVARILGHLCHIVGLARIAAGSFSFLFVYVAGSAVQAVALSIGGRDEQSVVHIMLWTQSITLAVMVLQALSTSASIRRRSANATK